MCERQSAIEVLHGAEPLQHPHPEVRGRRPSLEGPAVIAEGGSRLATLAPHHEAAGSALLPDCRLPTLHIIFMPFGTARSTPARTIAPAASAKPRVRTSERTGRIWRGGKLTTASTCRPTRTSGL